jgi:hypothetical protein
MNYQTSTIAEMMDRINGNKLVLPALQRSFVWDSEKIEKLFDSIQRGYPIGTFLFWKLGPSERKDFSFYRFLLDYHEHERYENEKAARPITGKDVVGVLDGQQRLNGLFIGLQGSYAYRKPWARKQADKYPKRELYWNLLAQNGTDEEEISTFRFLTAAEAAKDQTTATECWLHVKTLMASNSIGGVSSAMKDLRDRMSDHRAIFDNRKAAMRLDLRNFWKLLHREKLITFFNIEGQEHGHILEIFVRLNNAGTVLSKSDLLFSTITVHWEEGREAVETLLREINDGPRTFWFDKDFIMRACLVLTDGPVRFTVGSFGPHNVEVIKKNWNDFDWAIRETVKYLAKWGFTGETLPAPNAVIPIAYFLFKGGDMKKSEEAWKLYLIRALVQRVYSSQNDRVLFALRDGLREKEGRTDGFRIKKKRVPLEYLLTIRLPGRKTLEPTEQDLDGFLDEPKGPYAYLLLTLLYPDLKYESILFDQDHIHPSENFKKKNLKEQEISTDDIREWPDPNSLPNLQLLTATDNRSKSDTAYEKWFKKQKGSRKSHLKNHYIPETVGLGLRDFPAFYKARRGLLKTALAKVLGVRSTK